MLYAGTYIHFVVFFGALVALTPLLQPTQRLYRTQASPWARRNIARTRHGGLDARAVTHPTSIGYGHSAWACRNLIH